jgi:hypothetical protein
VIKRTTLTFMAVRVVVAQGERQRLDPAAVSPPQPDALSRSPIASSGPPADDNPAPPTGRTGGSSHTPRVPRRVSGALCLAR